MSTEITKNLLKLQGSWDSIPKRNDESGLFTLDQNLEDNKLRSIIQRLADDEEICKLISDERMRCEQHKQNYSKLKTEFNKITYENRLAHSDLNSLHLQYNDLKDTSAKALKHMEKEIYDLKCQLEYLHTKLPTKAQEVHTKREILLQVESTWGQRVADLLKEVEEFKASEAHLLSENQCLNSDLSRLKESLIQEKIDLNSLHEKKYEKLKDSYNSFKIQCDPKIFDLEQMVVKQKVELEELRNSAFFSNNQVRECNKDLRDKEKELGDIKEDFYKCSTTFASKEAQLTLELEKIEIILEDTNLKLEEEKKKCWDLTKTANAMKKDLTMLQDQRTEFAINQEAILSDQKVKHTIEKANLQREIDHYKRLSEEKENKVLNLKAELDSLKIKHEMRIKVMKEDMMMIRLENAKREIELDAKASQYQKTLEEVKQDIKINHNLEKKKLSPEDRSDSNKQRTMASIISNVKNTGREISETENVEGQFSSKQNQSVKATAQNSEGGTILNQNVDPCVNTANENRTLTNQDVRKEPESLQPYNENFELKEIPKSKKRSSSRDSPNKNVNYIKNSDPAVSKSNDIDFKNESKKEEKDLSKQVAKSRKNSAVEESYKIESSLKDGNSIEKRSISSKTTEKKTKSNQLSYDDLYERYTNLQSKHIEFSGILKRSPFSFDNKTDT